MVTMKIDSTGVDPNKSTGFEPYEGPIPKPGVYAAVIKSVKIRISQAGNPYFNVLFEFADQVTAEKQVYKSYPLFEKITPGDSDFQKERVGKLMYAVCGKVSGNVMHDEVTDGGNVTKMGGKDPVGVKVRLVTRRATYNGEVTAEMSDMFPWPKDQAWPDGPPEGAEDDSDSDVEEVEDETEEEEESEAEESEEEEEAEEEAEEDDGEFEARQEELAGLDRTALKAILKELDSEFKILKRHSDDDLREAIIDLEYPPVEGEDEEEGDDEPPF